MLNFSKPLLSVLTISVSILLLGSCTKKPVCPEPEPGNKTLTVELEKTYIGSSIVDSAFAIWESNGQQQRIALTKRSDSLVTAMDQFSAGTGTLSLQIFSKLKFGGAYQSQWIYSQQATITHLSGFIVAGPKSFDDQHWKPRVELKDGVGHSAVVALRPDDAYFFVKDVPGDLRKIVVARDYWKQGGGVSKVGGGEWKCSTDCRNSYGHIENSQYFSFLPAQIGSSPWNHIEITVLYEEDAWGGGPVLSMTHTL